jgi:hypothetical protein
MSPDHAAADAERAPDFGSGLAAAVAEARRRLGSGSAVDLAPLQRALADRPATASLEQPSGDLLALLDELGLLIKALEQERTAVSRRVGALSRHHRAEAAYVAAGRQP